MPYATSDDMVERFDEAQLMLVASVLVGDADTLDTAKIERAIAGADAIVDLHVGGRYAVPLDPVPAVILGISCDIARFKLYSDSTRPTESAKDAYEAAIAMLEAIRDGKATLDAAAVSSSDPASTANDVEMVSDDPVFTVDSLRNF